MSTAKSNRLDRIKVSVISNRLDAISKEIGQTMLRTSRSPIFSEARDFVTAVFDAKLRLVAQTAYIPVLMGALPYAIKSIAKTFEGDIDEGDIFILNDPFRGNNHPPDITIAKPVFDGKEIAFWAVSKGHHADVGGGGVAGYNPGAKSVWEECIRIPPAKLYAKGQPNKGLWDTILLNVFLSFLVEGDLQCQVGAVKIGERSLKALLNKYGRKTLDAAMQRIFDVSEQQMRAAIRGVPNGTYTSERLIDHDGIDKGRMIKVHLALKVEDESITFDYTGSDPQVAGYVNSTLPNTASASFLALFMSIGSEIRFNEGALAGAACRRAGRHDRQRSGARSRHGLHDRIGPGHHRVRLGRARAGGAGKVDAGWSRWCAPATMGLNPRTGRPFGDIHFMAKGGSGGSHGRDGWDHLGTVVCAGGLRAPDPELHELVDPFTVLQYEYWPDSAGAGEWRGGMGTIYRWKIDADGIPAANFGGGVSEATAPYGLEGGKPAPPHQLFLHKGKETTKVDAESFYHLDKGDVFEIYQSGGGGYGDPHKRPPEKVREDVVNGLISVAKARELYGVVIDAGNQTLDTAGTMAARRS